MSFDIFYTSKQCARRMLAIIRETILSRSRVVSARYGSFPGRSVRFYKTDRLHAADIRSVWRYRSSFRVTVQALIKVSQPIARRGVINCRPRNHWSWLAKPNFAGYASASCNETGSPQCPHYRNFPTFCFAVIASLNSTDLALHPLTPSLAICKTDKKTFTVFAVSQSFLEAGVHDSDMIYIGLHAFEVKKLIWIWYDCASSNVCWDFFLSEIWNVIFQLRKVIVNCER